MSYVVLARKYRPVDFESVIGQSHITGILKKAIAAGRLHHAYLFCGPRGIGKTSCARILAKCLNCEKGPTVTPCGRCSSCVEIARGNSFDVIEIDGASNRGIDEIRALRENVKFAPGYGRYKVYIVDEVHMLTPEAFNALLKTLEEPPEYVKFIFATTEPNKLPATIISRCQRFDFRRVSINGIISALESVCEAEEIKMDKDALLAVAKAASGSLRDALSILDQLSSLTERAITADDVTGMLGIVETEQLFAISGRLAAGECAKALDILEDIIAQGKDIKQLYKDLIEHFRNLMVLKIGGPTLSKLVDYPVAVKQQYVEQAETMDLARLLEAIDLWVEAQETARITQSLRIPLEVAFAKFVARHRKPGQGATAVGTKTLPDRPAGARETQAGGRGKSRVTNYSPLGFLGNNKGHVDISGAAAPDPVPPPDPQTEDEDLAVGDEVVASVAPVAGGEISLEVIRRAWNAITHAISREKMSTATYLQEGTPYRFHDGKLTVSFPETAVFHKESLEDGANVKLIERVMAEKLGAPLRVEFKILRDHTPSEDEPLIREALDAFKGTVVNQWHTD